MFRSISWQSFLSGLTILLLVYYAMVLLIYFRTEIKAMLSRMKRVGSLEPEGQPFFVSTEKEASSDPLRQAGVLALRQELEGLFHTAAQTKPVKAELYMALQMVFRGYPNLKTGAGAKQIQAEVANLCKNTCSITLSEAELKMLWNG
jgi:hypothetical protein